MAALRILKLLFCFKKPGVINLSYMHVFIKDKPTLFIVWEIKNVWSVRLIPLKHIYHTAQNTLVISIPREQHQVTLKAANFWRKTSIVLTLCAVELDELATAQLIHGFRPLNKIKVSAPHVSDIRNRILVRPFSVKHTNTVIKKIDRFNINIKPFNYP
jgi:hypothetical protein